MEILATYGSNFSVVGELDDTYLALAFGENNTVADSAAWDLEVYEDDIERATTFAALLDLLIDATVVDTETLSGIVVNVTDAFDWDETGTVRGLYTLKSNDSGTVYSSNSDDFDHLLELMQNFTEDAADTETKSE